MTPQLRGLTPKAKDVLRPDLTRSDLRQSYNRNSKSPCVGLVSCLDTHLLSFAPRQWYGFRLHVELYEWYYERSHCRFEIKLRSRVAVTTLLNRCRSVNWATDCLVLSDLIWRDSIGTRIMLHRVGSQLYRPRKDILECINNIMMLL